MFAFRIRPWIGVLIGAGALLVAAPSAEALFTSLSTTLTGPSIGGVVPAGNATIDQGGVPAQPGTVAIAVRDVNLPDGTILNVFLTDCGPFAVGSMTLIARQAQLTTAFRLGCQIGRLSKVHVRDGALTVLSSTRWSF